MLRQFVRGYGVLIACSLAILVSLLFYQEYKQDVLAYSLELVGDKLVDMSPKDEDRATIAAIYDAFKERVLAKEVPPAQVEHVAANVLNLNRNGATLTPEQAAAMLEPPMLALAAYDSLVGPARVTVEADRWVVLGERIKNVWAFEEKIQEIARTSHAEGNRLKEQIYYECKDGLRIAMDVKLGRLLTKELSADLQLLEKKAMVVWHERMADERDMRQRIEKDISVMADGITVVEPDLKIHLKRFRALKTLSKYHYHFDEEHLQTIVRRIKRQAERDWERTEKQAERDWKRTETTTEESRS